MDSPSTRQSLISEWVAKLAVNAGASLDAKTQAVYCSIWSEGLSDLSPGVLLAAFRKTLRECSYWPVKVADIRKHVSHAESNAVLEAAEKEWQRILECRRLYWNPDLGGFTRGMPKLSERVQQAARAAGIWRDFPTVEALHVWAKKKFIESYVAWGESEADKFLLPDGEIKCLLADVAKLKTLPTPKESFENLHERGLQYAEQIRTAAPLPAFNIAVAKRGNLWGSEEERENAFRSLGEKETSPSIADTLRAQKAALAEKGYSLTK